MTEALEELAPKVLAIGCVDHIGIAGTGGLQSDWEELGVPAPGNGRTYRALAGKADPTFRRLDGQTRALVLAAEACGIERMLSVEEREACALVVETSHGCLEVDLRYARALDAGVVHAAIFPYTLQSTCLGDVALRHGLRGPTLSLSVGPEQLGEALREAERLLMVGAVRHAVVGTVDVFEEKSLPAADPQLRAVVALLAAARLPATSVCDWPVAEGAASDPFEVLRRACRDQAG